MSQYLGYFDLLLVSVFSFGFVFTCLQLLWEVCALRVWRFLDNFSSVF